MKLTHTLSLVVALVAGLLIGWLDVGATEVQGTLLLLMVSAFSLALVTRTPAWMIAIAVTLGLPLAHLLAAATGQSTDVQAAMLIVGVPILVSAFAGRRVAVVIEAASTSINSDALTEPRAMSAVQLLGVALIGCALAGFVPVYASLVAGGQQNAWWLTAIWQVVTLIAWAAATPSIFRFWRSARAVSGTTGGLSRSELMKHGLMVLVIASAHALVLILMTRALFIPLSRAPLESAAWTYSAYLPIDALTYCLIAGLAHTYDANRRMRLSAARESAARGELASIQLSSLQAQLRPHFLFNALNAASVLAKRGDAERASDVLSRLSDLLRYVLRGAESQEPPSHVCLSEELAFAASYLAIEKERFGDRLQPVIEASEEARAAIVPHLVLQPLVENAIHHGIDARIAAGQVTVSAHREGERLVMTVDDDGPGPTASHSQGIGLANTRSRLATLYGEMARLELVTRASGGTRASVVIPYTT